MAKTNGAMTRFVGLPRAITRRSSNLVIAPFVFAIEHHPVLVPQPGEVAEILWAPLGPLASGAHDTAMPYCFEGRTVELPAYDVSGRIVWGLTHRMLSALFDMLGEMGHSP